MTPPAKPPTQKIYDLAGKLIGTPNMGEILEEVNDLSIEEARMLDFVALVCEGCDWWFAKRDIVDTGSKYYCRECNTDHESGIEPN